MPKAAVPGHAAVEQDSREARPPGLVPLGREAPWKEQQLCIGKAQVPNPTATCLPRLSFFVCKMG